MTVDLDAWDRHVAAMDLEPGWADIYPDADGAPASICVAYEDGDVEWLKPEDIRGVCYLRNHAKAMSDALREAREQAARAGQEWQRRDARIAELEAERDELRIENAKLRGRPVRDTASMPPNVARSYRDCVSCKTAGVASRGEERPEGWFCEHCAGVL